MSIGMKSGKVNQSEIGLINYAAVQFEPTKNANIFKDFYYDFVGKLVRNLPVVPNKFNNNSKMHGTKPYHYLYVIL